MNARLLMIAAAVLLTPAQANAWGRTGHRVVAKLADAQLSGLARAHVKELLGVESLDEAATWPDEMKSDPSPFWQKTASPWHYVTLNGITYDKAPPEGDALEALGRFRATLQDPGASRADKQLALRFIVHLAGDLHQPMHTGKCCDRGGNEVKVKWMGRETNLHAVWDSAMIDEEQLSFTEYAERLQRHTSPADVMRWWDVNPHDWISESAQYRDSLYPPPAKDGELPNLSWNYIYQHMPLVEQRLSQAGVRLAAYLNAIYSEPQAGGSAGEVIRRVISCSVAGACASSGGLDAPVAPVAAGPVEVQILALNDFHGNLERPASPVRMQLGDGQIVTAQAGGAAIVAAELAKLRTGQRNSITVAAGDLIGASPLTSAWFLDEPTIAALNMMGLSVASVGNHEFDKGSDELLRMQNGGCEKYTMRVPCRVEPFAGATFDYLAGNALRDDGTSVFPGSAIRDVGPVRIGFIGLTLEGTASLVTPSGVAGIRFADEAESANALVPKLKAQGADAIVLLIHQGGNIAETYALQGCDGLTGPILPILDKLDPAIATIVSGHTHNAYACEIERGGARRLLTSAGRNGYIVSDIRLTFDPRAQRLIGQSARNVAMIGDGSEDSRVASLVKRYSDAVEPVANRVIGRLDSAAPFSQTNGESAAANLIADATLAATRAPEHGGAQLALVNATGVRIGLPAGEVRFKDAFAMMPFGNNLLVVTLTGAQLKAALEQQFSAVASKPGVLAPSSTFTYAVDWSKPEGSRISDMRLNGRPIDLDSPYRVALNNYLASGGDNISAFTAGTDVTDRGLIDVDALVEWIGRTRVPPKPNRVRISGAEARRSS